MNRSPHPKRLFHVDIIYIANFLHTPRLSGCTHEVMIKTLTVFLAALSQPLLQAEETCRFTRVETPRNEARLLELNRTIDFRCQSKIPAALIEKTYANNSFMQSTQFLVERYKQGKCVSRKFISLGKYSTEALSDGNYESTMSFGWHMDHQYFLRISDTIEHMSKTDQDRKERWIELRATCCYDNLSNIFSHQTRLNILLRRPGMSCEA